MKKILIAAVLSVCALSAHAESVIASFQCVDVRDVNLKTEKPDMMIFTLGQIDDKTLFIDSYSKAWGDPEEIKLNRYFKEKGSKDNFYSEKESGEGFMLSFDHFKKGNDVMAKITTGHFMPEADKPDHMTGYICVSI